VIEVVEFGVLDAVVARLNTELSCDPQPMAQATATPQTPYFLTNERRLDRTIYSLIGRLVSIITMEFIPSSFFGI
jgi:hypothetical protein